jgi:hypothetical protein
MPPVGITIRINDAVGLALDSSRPDTGISNLLEATLGIEPGIAVLRPRLPRSDPASEPILKCG